MKKVNFKYLWLIVALMSIGIMACKDDDPVVTPADKAALVTKIAEADAMYDAAEVGKMAGEYTQASVDAFKVAIDAAKAVNTNAAATQEMVDATVSNLQIAMDAFEDSVIVEISVENLVAYWKLDGDGMDDSANGHDGTLKAGTTARWPNGVLPMATTDRFGAAGKALHFAHGANIEVPYHADFNPDEMTISLWLMADSLFTSSTQYLMSLNKWDCWKFELPNHGKPFITRKLSDDSYLDKDSNPVALDGGNWYNIIVTTSSTNCVFYINGVLAVDWDLGTLVKPIAADPLVNLVIGSFLPNDAEWDLASWFNSFHGSLDDVRFYDKDLTAAEALALHTMEKVD